MCEQAETLLINNEWALDVINKSSLSNFSTTVTEPTYEQRSLISLAVNDTTSLLVDNQVDEPIDQAEIESREPLIANFEVKIYFQTTCVDLTPKVTLLLSFVPGV